MSLITTVDNIKTLAINTPTVSMSSFGDISLYDNNSNSFLGILFFKII